MAARARPPIVQVRCALRTVVGTLITAGVRELDDQYDKSRQELFTSLGLPASEPPAGPPMT